MRQRCATSTPVGAAVCPGRRRFCRHQAGSACPIGADLMTILQALELKRVAVRILNLGMDTQTPTDKLMVTVLGGVAQFEREMMLERRREGIAKAKSPGK